MNARAAFWAALPVSLPCALSGNKPMCSIVTQNMQTLWEGNRGLPKASGLSVLRLQSRCGALTVACLFALQLAPVCRCATSVMPHRASCCEVPLPTSGREQSDPCDRSGGHESCCHQHELWGLREDRANLSSPAEAERQPACLGLSLPAAPADPGLPCRRLERERPGPAQEVPGRAPLASRAPPVGLVAS